MLKVSEIENPQLVLVTWFDITTHEGWTDDVPDTCQEIETVGWLLRRGDTSLTIVSSRDLSEQQIASATVIPLANVIKIEELKYVNDN